MKIAIIYPPLDSKKGIPFLAQNRQFQWAHDPWHAYPIVPACAATMLKKAGHEIAWLDGIAREQTYSKWEAEFLAFNPQLVMIETKTPVVKKHWQIINYLKQQSPDLITVLVGDHVTALPEESLRKSKADYVLTGGDYDFLFLNLVNHLTKKAKLESGIYYRQNNQIKNTGKFRLRHNLDTLPFIDRDLTDWRLYAFKNTNYGRTPGTYTMFGRDCWWGKCSFCSWTTLYPGQSYRVMSPKRALDEIGFIIDHWPVKEIMDDSGTFPVGGWLKEFCQGMIARGYAQKIKISCNMRFNARLSQADYRLMAKAGFRFALYGLESASQETLDRINKNLEVGEIPKVLKMAKTAGLWPHVTVMVGYPWETKDEALKTLALTKKVFKAGWVDTMQATIVIPYPGTPLFRECEDEGLVKTHDWDQYDMKTLVVKTVLTNEEISELVRKLYGSFWTPSFIFRKLREGFTDFDKFRYYLWSGLKYFSRSLDFGVRTNSKKTWKGKITEILRRAGRKLFSSLSYFARGF